MENLPGSIDAILGMLAERFGTTIEHLWGVMVRQASIGGVSNIILVVLLIASTVVVVRTVRKMSFPHTDVYGDIKTTKNGEPKENITDRNMAYLITGLILFMPWLVFVVSFSSIIAQLFNPEYWALQQVLKLFSGG